MAPIVIVTTQDLPSLVRRMLDGAAVSNRTFDYWAAKAGGEGAVLPTPIVVAGRPCWSLTVVRERLPRFGYVVNEEYARQICRPAVEGGRAVPGPVVLVGIAELAALLGLSESGVRGRRAVGVKHPLPAELFLLGSERAQASGKKLSPVWRLDDIEAAHQVDRKVAAELRKTNLFDR